MSVTFAGQTCSDDKEQAVLSKFDDYPIHQTPEPIAHPASSDKDTYERYWFNGYSRTGDMYLGIGTALYPHLGIQDCGISIVYEGRQYAFHASARAGAEPSEMRVGSKLAIISSRSKNSLPLGMLQPSVPR